MNAWEYDPARRAFQQCDSARAKAPERHDFIVYLDDGGLHISEGGVVRRWWPGDTLEKDGVRYVLPRAYQASVIDGGAVVPWRRELSGSSGVGDNYADGNGSTTFSRHDQETKTEGV